MRRRIDIRLEEDLLGRLDAEAKSRGMTRTRLIEMSIEEELRVRYSPEDVLRVRYACPVQDCTFTAGSSTARCPMHGRKVGL